MTTTKPHAGHARPPRSGSRSQAYAPTGARLYAFPPSRDTRLVTQALGTFQAAAVDGLDAGKEALERRYFAPIRARLARLGASPDAIAVEIYDLKCAIRDLSWREREGVA